MKPKEPGGVIARARKRTIPSTWKGNRKGQGRVCWGQYPGGPMNLPLLELLPTDPFLRFGGEPR